IVNHHEKQKFLKAVYENFYKAYNPLAADRLGIVYTPQEIVKFMIESTDYLIHKHFNKLLADPDVEILDPATGTGTFITELIEYLPANKLKYKYQNEIHCNEVAILPYYIANLNIEYTYQQKMGEYEEFNNICFVDTLDHTSFHGKQGDLFAMSLENTDRIKWQNDRTISVIIGNPPYNANQQNENDNNKNREYEEIDKRIKATYVKESTAQKTKVYDMYSRFFRWASDRLGDNGIIAFITNSSFINARGFDGFRKNVANEFDYIYVVDLGGDIRAGDTTGNVFNIMIGVAITFLVKTKSKNNKNKLPCQIMYFTPQDVNSGQEKLDFLGKTKFDFINFEHITPDKDNNWINLTDNDFDNLIPVASKETKLAKSKNDEKAIFKLFSLGISTNRDEWIIDYDQDNLALKMSFFADFFNNYIMKNNEYDGTIKWSRNLKTQYTKGKNEQYNLQKIQKIQYRPYCQFWFYNSEIFIDEHGGTKHFCKNSNISDNYIIIFTNSGSQKPFMTIVTNKVPDLHLVGAACGSQCLPLYSYDEKGDRIENITDWGLEQFRNHYQQIDPPLTPPYKRGGKKAPLSKGGWGDQITKLDIFHYVYAVLHNPEYRQKYELNLKREFPRIPFYDNFYQWVEWGKKLMELHINYETVTPYQLKRIDIDPPQPPLERGEKETPLSKGGRGDIKPKLKADKIKGEIVLDTETTLKEIPAIAWEYKLGNRSALEWILDQYKETKPKDPTIAEKFNNYRFADYKEQVIDLLKRVCTVSVETMKIIEEMEKQAS
ncbi:MAG TPA: type ISP restriction/modification enzyme, partial [Allocoleopsis sp.]